MSASNLVQSGGKHLCTLLLMTWMMHGLQAQSNFNGPRSFHHENHTMEADRQGVANGTEPLIKELLKADRVCANAAKNSDMETLWNCWDDEAVMLMSTELHVVGIGEIKSFTTQARTDPNFQIHWSPIAAYVSPSGDMGYTYGTGTVTRTASHGELVKLTQPYLSVWKKCDDNQWRIAIEN